MELFFAVLFFISTFWSTATAAQMPIQADPQACLSDGMDLYNQERYEEAFKVFTALSRSTKHPAASYFLAEMYLNGWGCKKNVLKAFSHCQYAVACEIEEAKELFERIIQEVDLKASLLKAYIAVKEILDGQPRTKLGIK